MNRIKMIKIRLNRKSKWIRIKNKMIRTRKSKIKKKKDIDTPRESKSFS